MKSRNFKDIIGLYDIHSFIRFEGSTIHQFRSVKNHSEPDLHLAFNVAGRMAEFIGEKLAARHVLYIRLMGAEHAALSVVFPEDAENGTQAENVAFFEKADVTIGPIYDISQIVEDPHVLARELIADYPDPDMGSYPMHHVVPRLSGTPASIRTPAPKIGEHNAALLAELGIDEATYQKLLAAGIVCAGNAAPTDEE